MTVSETFLGPGVVQRVREVHVDEEACYVIIRSDLWEPDQTRSPLQRTKIALYRAAVKIWDVHTMTIAMVTTAPLLVCHCI